MHAFIGDRPFPQQRPAPAAAPLPDKPQAQRRLPPWRRTHQLLMRQPQTPAPPEVAAAGDVEAEALMRMELPFELRVLEICLDELAADSEQRTRELELALKPAIDRLASNVRADTLDLMRRLKTKLVTLTSTMYTVRSGRLLLLM